MWFNTAREYLLINSAKGHVKDKNMREWPQIAVVILDPDQPLRYVQGRDRVVEITENGARKHINAPSLKYTNKPWIPREHETRVTCKILPESVFADD